MSALSPTAAFSTKAERYARFRWDYAPQAAQALAELAGLGPQSAVLDAGAGTGIFTRRLAGRAGLVIALEPNHAMRRMAARLLAGLPGLRVAAGTAEATGLASRSVDLVVAATAFNWFDPLPARREFARILKPGGWLAGVANRPTGPNFGPDLAALYPAQAGAPAAKKVAAAPVEWYLEPGSVRRFAFPLSIEEDWEHFLGGLASASYAPDEGHPFYPAFERGARALFERFSLDGVVTLTVETQVTAGRLARAAL